MWGIWRHCQGKVLVISYFNVILALDILPKEEGNRKQFYGIVSLIFQKIPMLY
jgi:hypothetical protein